MSLDLLAQASVAGELGHYVILAIIVAGIVGIGLVAARAAGLTVPAFVVTIAWILLACVVGVVAIKFLLSMSW
jgi:hypothetical protein